MKKPYVIGIVAAVIGLIVLISVLVSRDDSPDDWIAGKYKKAGAGAYRSPKPPQQVSGEITRKFKAIDRVDDVAAQGAAGGIFLQYPETMVAVLPEGRGSRITVDSPRTGYSRYHSHVGGFWSSPGSRGWNSNGSASFRGGGPGSGK